MNQGRQTVFFAAVNPEEEHLDWAKDYDATKPRKVPQECLERAPERSIYGERKGRYLIRQDPTRSSFTLLSQPILLQAWGEFKEPRSFV